MKLCSRVIAIIVMFISSFTAAQVATGTPAFGSFGGGPFDIVNLGNLNVHFAIPILHKAGRGTPFTYDLSYDSSVWYPVTSNGVTQWQPADNWGWTTDTAAYYGYVVETVSTSTSSGPPCSVSATFTKYAYHDSLGRVHPFPGQTWMRYGDCLHPPTTYSGPLNATALDGSGYTINVGWGAGPTVTSASGAVVTSPTGSQTGTATYTDANGNQLSVDNSGHYFDTLSTGTPPVPVLTVAPGGTQANPTTTLTYTGPSGNPAPPYTINYTQYTVATNFDISGVTEYGPATVALVSSITLPDGTSYSFQYESGASSCTLQPDTTSCVTGRIQQVTLPTGGVITYAYSGGPTNSGIYGDGSTANLIRTLNPGGPWTYTRQLQGSVQPGPGSSWITTGADPQGNNTVMNFAEDSTTTASDNSTVATYNMYETQRVVYQGGNVLSTQQRCYNAYGNCATAAVASPIGMIATYTQPANGNTRASQVTYSGAFYGSGLVSEDDEYDYGVAMGANLFAYPPARKTTVEYANLANGPVNRPYLVFSYDGNGNKIAGTGYGYDAGTPTPTVGTPNLVAAPGARGNLTSISYMTSATNSIITTYSYYDTGNVNRATDVNSATTTYLYTGNPCGNAFPTQTNQLPSGLSSITSWDCNGGVPLSSTKLNGQPTRYAYDEFWRLIQTSYPDGGQTGIQYNLGSANPSITTTTVIGANNNAFSTALLDGFARTIETQLTSDPSGTDKVDTVYDQLGRVYTISNPYRSTSDPTYGLTTYGYDALGRTVSRITPDGKTYQTQYFANVVTTTDPNSVQRQYTYDGLGRLSSVVEPNPITGSLTFQSYTTNYVYDPVGNLTSVVQNGDGTSSSTRGFAYDWLGRLTSVSNPETGTINYTYDSTTGSTSTGDLVQVTSPAPNQTGSATVNKTYVYDSLHRLTSIAYSDGTTPSACYQYDAVSPNGAGSLAAEWTQSGACAAQPPSAPLTERVITAYDPMGRITGEQQCTPLNCGAGNTPNSMTYSYDYLGTQTSSSNGLAGAQAITISAQYNNAHQLQGVTSTWNDQSHPGSLFSAPTYSAAGLTDAMFGTGLTFHRDYDTRLRSYAESNQGFIANPNASIQISGAEQSKGVATPSTGSVAIAGSEQSMQKQTAPGTSSTGTILVSGTEQSKPQSGTPGTGYVTISGTEQTKAVSCPHGISGEMLGSMQPDLGGGGCLLSDAGTVSIIVNGVTATAGYGSGSTSTTIATALASAINQNGSYPVSAVASGTKVTLTAKTTGTITNYSLSASDTYMSSQFSQPSFTGTPSGSTLTGGTGGTTYDAGTATVIINNHTAHASWGQSSTWQSISTALASAITSASGGTLQASFNGSLISISSTGTGSGTNWPISATTSYDSTDFASSSFSLTSAGMSGGNNPTMTTVYDSGTVTITVNGSQASVSYGQIDTGSTLASKLASAIGTCTSSFPAGATASGSTVSLTSCQQGSQVNYALTSASSYDSTDFSSPSFTPSPSGSTMTGGTGTTVYDSGTVTLAINNVPGSTSVNQNSTAQSIASGLAAAFNGNSEVSVTVNGATLNIVALSGSASDYAYSVSSTYDSNDFSGPSFSASPASGTLSGGATPSPITVYSYSLGYNPNGTIQSVADSVMGTWNYSYDTLNRLTQGQSTSGDYIGATLGWSYDPFGNRLSQSGSGNPSMSITQTNYTFNQNNQIVGLNYDAAGNLLKDASGTQYTYDAENRVIAINGASTQYVYDAEGRRVAKLASGAVTNSYVRGLGGEQITETDGQGNWSHTNVFVQGRLLATYDSNGLHFYATDWLGSRRAQTNYAGVLEQTCQNLPFGDVISGANCTGTVPDPTEHHFTGQEHDMETGLDHFMYREYASSMGRWLRPDPDMGSANPANPQSWNRYSYVMNKPLRFVDPLGLNLAFPFGAMGTNKIPGSMTDPTFSYSQASVSGSDGTLDALNAAQLSSITYSWYESYTGTDVSMDGVPVTSGIQYHLDLLGISYDYSTSTNPDPVLLAMNSGGPNIGGSPSNGTPATPNPLWQKLKHAAVWYMCGSSPVGAVQNWMETGATKGAATGAWAGFGAAGVATFGVGGIPGAALGGFVGGVAGAAGGVIGGGIAAGVCSVAGAY